MRTIGFRSVLTSTGQITAGLIEDVHINAAAAIAYSKLNSAAVDAALIPDATGTRNLGSAAKRWGSLSLNTLEGPAVTTLRLWSILGGE